MAPVRTLVVDDNVRFLDAVTRFLKTCAEIEVVGQAATGHAAVAAVSDLRPELILMDLAMPGMNGIQATQVIKDEPNAPRVVIVTFDDTEEHRAEARGAGADGVLSKSNLVTSLGPLVREMFY